MPLIRQRTGFFENHPVLTATTAASGGVLLGAYVAMQIFAAPVPNETKVPAVAPVADARRPTKPTEEPAESIGSAPAKQEVTMADRCEGETWPYLTRECTERMRRDRPARVVTTDRVQTHEPETSEPSRTESVAAPPAPAGKPVESAAPKPAMAVPPPSASPPPAAVPAAVAASAPADPQTGGVTNDPASASKSAGKPAEKRKSRQARQRLKQQERVRDNPDEGDGLAFAGIERRREVRERGGDEVVERMDRAERRSLRVERRPDRPRRERFAGSRGDDEGDAVSERRGPRVIVIERGSGEPRSSGLLGGLFGAGSFGD